ncbi:MAG TPA: alpha/beta hydrolase [Casimicrobiaceae bacterium]|nr:alpha/beta hydrolase [Casimicrobiaceae bacterium]
MLAKAARLLKWLLVLTVVILATVLGVRAWDAHRSPPLDPWHTYAPHEMTAKEIDGADWKQYLSAEQAAQDEVRTEVTEKLEPEARNSANRYFSGSPVYPGNFAHDWNRSFVLDPVGTPAGAVVLLHGLTDTPYSVRKIAQRYAQDGFVAVAIRLPGHGTVPAGLTHVEWEQWVAATRLAVREAQRRAGAAVPLHVVGYSNGGALAMKYALDAIGDKALPRPARIVLISPMIGITSMARFAGIAGWPAIFPAFAKAAWLDVVPEFNPFKYNSFPVNAARQSSLISRALQRQIAQYASEGRLAELAPILTFQSVVDFTVSTRAIVSSLYVHLPANGSELVLFDLNRSAQFGPLFRPSADNVLARLLPAPPRAFRTTIITNASASAPGVVELVTEAGATTERVRPLDLAYPRDVFSLAHIALPFAMDDALYGLEPSRSEDFGVNLGATATRGERGALVISIDSLSRMSANPFFPYMLERIEEGIGGKTIAK